MIVVARSRTRSIFATMFLIGTFVVAGHHFAIVASADEFDTHTPNHDALPHPGHEHQSPNLAVEAHSPTPIIQKFQLQKHLEITPTLSAFGSSAINPLYQKTESVRLATYIVRFSVPLDLKTMFLN